MARIDILISNNTDELSHDITKYSGIENKESYDPPMFRKKKHNFPRNHKSPKGVQEFLAAAGSHGSKE